MTKTFIHPDATVTDSEIGEGTRVWQYASVIRGAELGERCNVASGATIDGSKFGDDCIICHNVAMGPGFRVGNRVFVGPNVVFCNDMWPTVDREGWGVDAVEAFASVIVDDNVSIGANATILPGVHLYKECVVAAGAVVDKDVMGHHLFRRDGRQRPLPARMYRKRVRFATP